MILLECHENPAGSHPIVPDVPSQFILLAIRKLAWAMAYGLLRWCPWENVRGLDDGLEERGGGVGETNIHM